MFMRKKKISRAELAILLLLAVSIEAWVRSRNALSPHAAATSSIIHTRSSSLSTPFTQLYGERRLVSLSLNDSETKVAIVSRTVPITNEWDVTVWELETPAPLVENYWSAEQEQDERRLQSSSTAKTLDPFGFVTWPGAVVAAHELLQHYQETNATTNATTVLVLGSGVGVEVQVALQWGATHVYALDIHPTTLQLLSYGVSSHHSHQVTTHVFDLCCHDELLPFLHDINLMIVADVLYNPQLAQDVARRCGEAYRQGIKVLITDSQRFVPDFEQMIQQYCSTNSKSPLVKWQERRLNDFTGSGILVEQDQTYNVTARVLWLDPAAADDQERKHGP